MRSLLDLHGGQVDTVGSAVLQSGQLGQLLELLLAGLLLGYGVEQGLQVVWENLAICVTQCRVLVLTQA